MKTFALLLLFVGFATFAKADQLAYLSKEDAERAAEFIRTQKTLYLFCGCCDGDTPVKISPVSVEVVYTNYEDYYEVIVTYKENGQEKQAALDLAYTWFKKKRDMLTVGSAMNLEHDICNPFPKGKARK